MDNGHECVWWELPNEPISPLEMFELPNTGIEDELCEPTFDDDDDDVDENEFMLDDAIDDGTDRSTGADVFDTLFHLYVFEWDFVLCALAGRRVSSEWQLLLPELLFVSIALRYVDERWDWELMTKND